MDDALLNQRARSLIEKLRASPQSPGDVSPQSMFLEPPLILKTLLENGFSDVTTKRDIMYSVTVHLQELGLIVAAEVNSGIANPFSTEFLFTRYLFCTMRDPEFSSLELEELEEKMISHVEIHSTGLNIRCVILKALLHSPRVKDHERHFSSIASSLCESWWTGKYRNTQHLSPYYSMMVFTEAFVELHILSESKPSSGVLNTILHGRASVVIVQILARVLAEQNNDGSWGPRNCAATTAYGVLTLLSIVALPYVQILMAEIRSAVIRGRQALSLMQDRWTDPHPVWIGNVAYGSANFSETYSLSAMKKPFVEPACSEKSKGAMEKQMQKITGFVNFFSSLEHMSQEPLYMIKASMLEASFYRSALQAMRTDVFPATQAKEKDKYLDYIPIMWILPSTCKNIFSPPEFLLDMMVLSMYIFLVDEYMESTVMHFSRHEFAALRASLEAIHPENEPPAPTSSPPNPSNTPLSTHPPPTTRLLAAITTLHSFATYITTYPSLLPASPTSHLALRSETKAYLLHHLTQLEDNHRLTHQPPTPHRKFLTPRTPYPTWLHTVGTGHVSGPFSFAFFLCHTSALIRGGRDTFRSVTQQLMAHDMNAHYGAFCRMYNDYGSVVRDGEEGNLNSVNFGEFFDGDGGGDEGGGIEKAKERLLDAARWERERALEGAERLYRVLEGEGAERLYRVLEGEGEEGVRVRDCLRVYVGAGEGFSDMYVTRDVTNSVV